MNLVSDVPGLAPLLDPAVKNPWGIAMGPTTPLWVNNQFNPASAGCETCIPAPEDLLTKITLYSGANGSAPFAKVPLEVTASSPTGIVFNPTSDFVITQSGVATPARFLFNELFLNAAGDGPEAKVTGWSNVPAPAPTTTATNATKDGAFHAGLALVPGNSHHGPRLLAADFENGVIDVYDSSFNKVTKKHLFVDPKAMRQGFSPYNVAFLKERVYVAYANDTGGGALSVFKAEGKFRKRLVTNGKLVGPWGMVIAPHHWGHFGGNILVGNVDDGTINAFNRRNGHFRGTVKDAMGQPLVNPGLWGLAFGNGTIGTPRTLLFSAGVGNGVGGFGDEIYEHGLVGLIEPVS